MGLISREAVANYVDNMQSELTEDGRRMIRQIRVKEFIADCSSAFEGMTNRDVLKALFPIDENKGARFTKVYLDNEAIESFELLTTQKWLDSPYKGVSE